MSELKPCPFCDGTDRKLGWYGYDENYGEGVDMRLEWENGKPSISAVGLYDGGYCCGSASVEIDYCPFCGRKLVI